MPSITETVRSVVPESTGKKDLRAEKASVSKSESQTSEGAATEDSLLCWWATSAGTGMSKKASSADDFWRFAAIVCALLVALELAPAVLGRGPVGLH